MQAPNTSSLPRIQRIQRNLRSLQPDVWHDKSVRQEAVLESVQDRSHVAESKQSLNSLAGPSRVKVPLPTTAGFSDSPKHPEPITNRFAKSAKEWWHYVRGRPGGKVQQGDDGRQNGRRKVQQGDDGRQNGQRKVQQGDDGRRNGRRKVQQGDDGRQNGQRKVQQGDDGRRNGRRKVQQGDGGWRNGQRKVQQGDDGRELAPRVPVRVSFPRPQGELPVSSHAPLAGDAGLVERAAKIHPVLPARCAGGVELEAHDGSSMPEDRGADTDEADVALLLSRAGNIRHKLLQTRRKTSAFWNIVRFTAYVICYLFLLGMHWGDTIANGRAHVDAISSSIHPVDTRLTQDSPMLEWITSTVRAIWDGQVCGDGYCDAPLEFPAFGPLGCKVDCGSQQPLIPIMAVLQANFSSRGSSQDVLQLWTSVRWNLCTARTGVSAARLPALCWYSEDQALPRYGSDPWMSTSAHFDLRPGRWFLRIHGDYTQTVRGALYDISNSTSPQSLSTYPPWEACQRPSEEPPSPRLMARHLLAQTPSNKTLAGHAEPLDVPQARASEAQLSGARHHQAPLRSLAQAPESVSPTESPTILITEEADDEGAAQQGRQGVHAGVRQGRQGVHAGARQGRQSVHAGAAGSQGVHAGAAGEAECACWRGRGGRVCMLARQERQGVHAGAAGEAGCACWRGRGVP
ncbi:hypothetical protein CYMTET_7591 [Cymbomonas tetramitiformis]|uniref:Uncharacterized protein n=1 Tax=Cymbomonas tetramitiformis TaxID=36881 RepID=A0AAE0GV60_9CHLO|nr:hypothetical protein CYMTET_7591 [Cymbomonas tetramitiformis]